MKSRVASQVNHSKSFSSGMNETNCLGGVIINLGDDDISITSKQDWYGCMFKVTKKKFVFVCFLQKPKTHFFRGPKWYF